MAPCCQARSLLAVPHGARPGKAGERWCECEELADMGVGPEGPPLRVVAGDGRAVVTVSGFVVRVGLGYV
nr:hypothetical protein StreXyl84_39510 [Streptomyces sp. Xyl84]